MATDTAGISALGIRSRHALRILLRGMGIVTLRERERDFVFACIARMAANHPGLPLRIMDVGSASSYVPLSLAKQGHWVVAVDIRPYPFRHPNLTFLQGDVTAKTFGHDLPPFDVITCISTLEHIGKGYYGGPEDPAKEKAAVAAMHRLLKPRGNLLLTVPFAGSFCQDDFQRVYDFARFYPLFARGWRLREERFHIPRSKKHWVTAGKHQVQRRYSAYPESNHACFWFEKV